MAEALVEACISRLVADPGSYCYVMTGASRMVLHGRNFASWEVVVQCLLKQWRSYILYQGRPATCVEIAAAFDQGSPRVEPPSLCLPTPPSLSPLPARRRVACSGCRRSSRRSCRRGTPTWSRSSRRAASSRRSRMPACLASAASFAGSAWAATWRAIRPASMCGPSSSAARCSSRATSLPCRRRGRASSSRPPSPSMISWRCWSWRPGSSRRSSSRRATPSSPSRTRWRRRRAGPPSSRPFWSTHLASAGPRCGGSTCGSAASALCGAASR
mmetsp:Transcript_48167/g.160545  ORF Transcript_48167/g.160545 Transcript_48167/m.160545 type:complete len:272 (+) Transcript_48167:293-1108(+)